jgi:hypothetical protein
VAVSGAQASALERAISPDRLGTYLVAAGSDRALARDLYVWDRDVAAAVLADIAIVEVALRNALNEQLTAVYGPEWYRANVGFDERTCRELATAWGRLSQRTPGRVIASLMFGFWVGLLDTGGVTGRAPQNFPTDYEALWRSTLSRAFPGGRVEARAEGATFKRQWVHSKALVIQALRNRCAHHEPLVRGFPLPGQSKRVTVQDGQTAYVTLLRMIDRDLAAWLDQNSMVAATLSRKP